MEFELLWIEGGNRITLSWPAFFTKEVLRSPLESSQVLKNILEMMILPLHKNGQCLVCWFYSDSLSGGDQGQCHILPLFTIKLSDYLEIPVHRWTRSLSSKCNPYNHLIYGHGLRTKKEQSRSCRRRKRSCYSFFSSTLAVIFPTTNIFDRPIYHQQSQYKKRKGQFYPQPWKTRRGLSR